MRNSKSYKHKSIPVALYLYIYISHLTSFDPYHCKIMILEQVILSLNLVCTIQESVREIHWNMEPATPPRTYTYEAGTNLHESCVERFPSSVVFQNTQTNNNPNQHSTISWPVWVPKRWCWYPSQLWNWVKTADVAESLWSQPGFHASFREVGRRVLACCSQVAGDIIRVWLLIWFEEYFRHCQRFLGLNVFGPKAVLPHFGGWNPMHPVLLMKHCK